MKLYLYPDAPTSLKYYEQYGYPDCVPFSYWSLARGIKDLTPTQSPEDADLFYCGFFHDSDRGLITPERFPWLQEYPEKHILDKEGDWGNCELPDWLWESGANIIGANI